MFQLTAARWEVEGLGPALQVSDVRFPDGPFPRVNDLEKINGMQEDVPTCILVLYCDCAGRHGPWSLLQPEHPNHLSMVGGYMLVLVC